MAPVGSIRTYSRKRHPLLLLLHKGENRRCRSRTVTTFNPLRLCRFRSYRSDVHEGRGTHREQARAQPSRHSPQKPVLRQIAEDVDRFRLSRAHWTECAGRDSTAQEIRKRAVWSLVRRNRAEQRLNLSAPPAVVTLLGKEICQRGKHKKRYHASPSEPYRQF